MGKYINDRRGRTHCLSQTSTKGIDTTLFAANGVGVQP